VYSYSAELWAVSFVIFAQAYALTLRRKSSTGRAQRTALPLSSAISSAMVVTFLGFNQAIYGQFLPKLSAFGSDLSTSVSYYFASLFRTSPPVPYAWIPPPSSPALLVVHIAWPALAFAPFILMFPPVRKWAASPAAEEPKDFGLFFGGLTLAWIAEVSVYAAIGGLRATLLRIPSFAAPFLGLVLIGRLRRQTDFRTLDRGRILGAYSIALVIVSIASFGLAISSANLVTSSSHYEHADNGAFWLHSRAPIVTTIFSDQNTQGRYSVVFADQGIWFDPNHLYTLDSYSHLVEPGYAASADTYFQNKYVVVNLELDHKQTTAGGWQDFEPLAPHLSTIESNVNLALIYADGNSDIFLGTGG